MIGETIVRSGARAGAKKVSIPMEFANGKKVKYYKVSVKATK